VTKVQEKHRKKKSDKKKRQLLIGAFNISMIAAINYA